MTRVIQMPGIYIRGAIATQTMKSLTKTQVEEIGKIVERVYNDSTLFADRIEFIKQFKNTIGGDYQNNDASIQEFKIAIWRATVNLLHHRSYSYQCTNCDSTSYNTGSNKIKSFDMQYPVCPCCNIGWFDIDGNGRKVKLEKNSRKYRLCEMDGTKIVESKYKNELKVMCKSVIKPVPGELKNKDPYGIINDPSQRNKWYTVWIWNYFRQHINENKIAMRSEKNIPIFGNVCYIAAMTIINLCKKFRIKHYYSDGALNNVNAIKINMNPLSADPDLSKHIIDLIMKYKDYGLKITPKSDCIEVTADNTVDLISDFIQKCDVVDMVSFSNPNDDTDNGWANTVESNVVNDKPKSNNIEDNDFIDTIRSKIKGDIAIKVYDIIMTRGKLGCDFSDKYGDKSDQKHVCEFLDIPYANYDNAISEIKDAYMATDNRNR